jgi:tRNA pseudouridine38-40 synthase
MPTFKLTIAYDGAGLVGWQRQAVGDSVQGLIERACRELDGRAVTVTGAGRTDAGVHALGQVASVTLTRTIDARALVAALNARLPATVRVIAAEAVADTFHARFHARSKTYRYRVWNAEVLSPFERAYAWHVPTPELDADAMNQAAILFEGTHDFAAVQATGSDVADSVRTVFSSRVRREDESLLIYQISGSGFLRHMVRNIVGALVEVGRGRRVSSWVRTLLATRDRSAGGPTAPAEGLFLVRVEYDDR